MNTIKLLVFCFFIGQLAACAVMSKTECLNADWQSVGYDVGFAGERDTATAYNRRAEICVKHGARANWLAFKAGHDQGIGRYCEPDNAILLGIKGRRGAMTEQVCPERDYPGFSKAFYDGYKLHELNARLYQSEDELRRLDNALHRYRHKRAELKRQIRSGDLSDQEIHQADYQRKQLRRHIQSIQADIYACRQRVSRHQAHARSYADLLELEYAHSLY